MHRSLVLLFSTALVLLLLQQQQQQLVVTAAAASRCPGSPNQCSLHGACVFNRQGERVCNCQWGYDASDCSKSALHHKISMLFHATYNHETNFNKLCV